MHRTHTGVGGIHTIIRQQRDSYYAFMTLSQTPTTTAPLVTVGILTYNSERYLRRCLDSLLAQDYPAVRIVILDNASHDQTVHFLREHYPSVSVVPSVDNLGFSKGHNRLLRESTAGPYYLCLNVDIVLERTFIRELVEVAERHPQASAVSGKLKRWDFRPEAGVDRQTNYIDTVGLQIDHAQRVTDISQGEMDEGQHQKECQRWGLSGAAVLYRVSALRDVAYRNDRQLSEAFDETMFMYKEDVDLAYRLQWAGYEAWYAPKAVAYHDRTVHARGDGVLQMIQNRWLKDKHIQKWSYRNQRWLVAKNWSYNFGLRATLARWWFGVRALVYITLLETETLGTLWWHWQRKSELIERREAVVRRRKPAEMAGWFQ